MTPQSLDTLPFDIFYQIATSLDDRDFINLSRTTRALRALTQSEQIARKTVENELLYSKEGQAAVAAQSGYRKAVGHRFDIHEAVAMANPYSVATLGYAADFLYNQGILCYRWQEEIRLLDVHGDKHAERVIYLPAIHDRFHVSSINVSPGSRITLVAYSDEILVFRETGVSMTEDILWAINTERASLSGIDRKLLSQPIPAGAPLFVRHNRSYIWFGTFMAADGSDGVWSVTGWDFLTKLHFGFQLDRVVDGDLGQTLCFEIYQDHLYAVSTQVASDDNELHSSFYHWSCHAPREAGRTWNGRFWRREHGEGPINEMWTDLSIRTDEVTGRPMILECRREWRHGGSENHRTYYTQRLPTPEDALAPLSEGAVETPSWVSLDDNLDDDHPYDERPAKRLRRNYHAEYENGSDEKKRQEFIAVRTKHRNYHLGSSTFLDLVNDPAPIGGSVRSRDRLRLRTVSRKRKSPIDEKGTEGPCNKLFQPIQFDQDGRPVEDSEERFACRGVHLWPSDNAPPALHHLLCPDARTSFVKGISDERSLIYSVPAPGLPADHHALILISFDPQLYLPTLQPLSPDEEADSRDIFHVKPQSPNYYGKDAIQEAQPFFLPIRRGYWLR
ncbi:uncharacterized protein N7511_011036 [Penicillium nucicola]|uniref:uncharacterized protein n=1 Tax=Penicillium nucicola TaxID=1850975 RepID=UPI002544F414|nr:uncharacterized protein N7511_011036 [Penicillium nucicola]KAJ5749340.1 hypothetical protein N7511_011036 [Penicillium nucicola]